MHSFAYIFLNKVETYVYAKLLHICNYKVAAEKQNEFQTRINF